MIPPGASAEWTERITPGQECPHDNFGIQPRTGTIGISEDGVPIRNIESLYGGGVRSLPVAAGNCLLVMFPTAPVPSARCPGRGDPCRGCFRTGVSHAEPNRQWPVDLPEVAGNVRPVLLAGGSPQAGLVNSVGPVALSPHAEKILEPLEHMVHIQADPAGQFSATGTLSPSDCYPVGPVGPVGPYVAGGPVGPDVYNTDPNSLTHMVRIPADPDGQDAAATGTSPSDCYPAGPYVAGGPVGPYDCLPALESCEHADHADPVRQHDADLDTAESL